MKTWFVMAVLFASLWPVVHDASAQTLRERIAARRAASTQPSAQAPVLPTGARMIKDVAYGDDPRQRFDVYLPASPRRAPVILLVHGGGWANGNKDNPGLATDKARYWLAKGYVLVSSNYRMLPDTRPLEQARDVARAVAKAQSLAGDWNADRTRFVLMGHSAGAHLVALLGASPAMLQAAGATRPLGVVALDSAAMDVTKIMQAPRHFALYDRAFGKDPAYWRSVSPTQNLSAQATPMLAVCSSRRADSCAQAELLSARAGVLGTRVQVLPEDLSHMEINKNLGKPSAYTEAVDAFLRSVDKR
jgi:arylformamidase